MDSTPRRSFPPWIPLTALSLLGLAVGYLVPDYYDWTGADQSRPSPVVLPTAIGILAASVVACGILPWIPIGSQHWEPHLLDQKTFPLRSMLGATVVAAVIFAAYLIVPAMVVSGILMTLAFAYLIFNLSRFGSMRIPAVAMVACLYLPYTWVIPWGASHDAGPSSLAIFLGIPAFFPNLLVSSMVEEHSEQLAWLMMAMAACQIAIGTWTMRLGPKRFLVFLVVSMLLSVYGSFILNALVRV